MWCTALPGLSAVRLAVCPLWQPAVVQIWSAPDTMVQVRALGDSVSTHETPPVVRIVTVNRGSVPAAYVEASVVATTLRSLLVHRAFGLAVDVVGDGETEGAAALGGCEEPPEHANATAAISTAIKASKTNRRVQ